MFQAITARDVIIPSVILCIHRCVREKPCPPYKKYEYVYVVCESAVFNTLYPQLSDGPEDQHEFSHLCLMQPASRLLFTVLKETRVHTRSGVMGR